MHHSYAQRNSIHCLRDSAGSLITEDSLLMEMVVDFYRLLLGSVNPDVTPPSVHHLRLIHPFRSTPAINHLLSAFPSPESIFATVHHLPSNKAPGPDGLPIDFYRACWPIIEHDVVSAVLEFFTSGKLLKQLNATSLSLIPKVTGTVNLKDFRPISCCNHFYKIISSILAGRLKLFLPKAVQNNQVGFVSGRQLCENILLASELISDFNKPGPTTRGCLKIDLTKAFDNLHWDFILQLLRAFDLPDTFIGWIRECITSPSFSINFNGDLTGYFQGSKGLRQGDPISSDLFVLAMDVLSKKLDAAVASGAIRLHPSCQNPVISHLSFADDMLIFFYGSDHSLRAILSVLDDFYRMSGLGINLLKSTLFLDGSNPTLLHDMAARYGLAKGTFPVKYLGVPLLPNKMRPQDFQPLIDRLNTRFTSWTNRHLSFAGRLQLIQSVIYSVVNFWASVFMLPNSCLETIEKLCNAFLWSGTTLSAKSAKISWDSVCSPRSSGGLGLRRLAKWNNVLGLKLIWLLFSNSGSLWVSWVKTHLISSHTFWDVSPSYLHGSWMWRRLLKLRDIARSFLFCRIGTGNTCYFWQDNWTGWGPLILLIGQHHIRLTGIPANATISQAIQHGHWLISTRSRNQVISFLRSILPPADTLLHPSTRDSFIWTAGLPEPDRLSAPARFSASKTFKALNLPLPKVPWYKSIWFSGRIPKHAFTCWVIARDRLPTRDKIRRFSPQAPSSCVLCHTAPETREHLLFTCTYSQYLLTASLRLIPPDLDFSSVLQWLRLSSTDPTLKLIYHLIFQAVAYLLWRERNARIHTAISRTPPQLIKEIFTTIKIKLLALSHSTPQRDPSLLQVWFRHQASSIPTSTMAIIASNSSIFTINHTP